MKRKKNFGGELVTCVIKSQVCRSARNLRRVAFFDLVYSLCD